jgi:hypothetical protein
MAVVSAAATKKAAIFMGFLGEGYSPSLDRN